VFLGAGTHIVFGRLSAEEMKLYSEMGGIIRENVEQRSYSTNSILTKEPGYTESVRNTPTITNVLEGSDLRLLDFQELTIFTINNGRVLPGQLARVFFIKEEAYDMRNYRTILWEKVVPEAFKEPEEKNQTSKKEGGSGNAESIKEKIKAETKVPETESVNVLTEVRKETSLLAEEKNAGNGLDTMSMDELFQLLEGPAVKEAQNEQPEDFKEKLKTLSSR